MSTDIVRLSAAAQALAAIDTHLGPTACSGETHRPLHWHTVVWSGRLTPVTR